MASTPVGSNAPILEVLDRSNYKHWRSRLKTYLLAEDLWEVVELEPPEYEDDQTAKARTIKNAKALYAIQNTCGRELFSFISEIETAKRAWVALEQECKIMQGYDENNKSFIKSVSSGDWDKAKNCLGEVDMRSVVRALHVAAEEGHAHIVKELVPLMTQEDLKTKTDSGHTALHLAVEKGHVDVVNELPVRLMGEVQDWTGKTALHLAVLEGKVDIVKELVLLMRSDDIEIKNRAGYTALHEAVNKGNVPVVREFVTKQRGDNYWRWYDPEGYIAFITYVTNGDWDNANRCLEERLLDPCGAITAVDDTYDYRETALHVAARQGHLDVTKGLVSWLKREQEVVAEDFTFSSSIISGVSRSRIMEQLNDMVKQYEKTLGSCLEIQNARGYTALHLAVLKGHVDIVKELVPLMNKEGLEIKNADENTALNTALLKGHVDIAKQLVQSMRLVGLEIKNKNGSNALDLAVETERMDFAKQLMTLMSPEALKKIISRAIQYLMDGDVCEMAKYMAEKRPETPSILFGMRLDTHDDDIPVVRALRHNKWKSGRYMYSVTPLEALEGPNGSSFICLCLNASNTIDLAWDLLQRYPNLAFTVAIPPESTPMMKLARMHFAFLSGTRLTRWQRWLYDCIPVPEVVAHVNIHDISINIAESKDDHDNKWDFISSVMTFFRRFAKGVYKFGGIRHIYLMKSTHKSIFQFLHCMGEATRINNLTTDQLDIVKKSIFNAIEQGHHEFVTHLCKANPKLLWEAYDERGMTIFHYAIRYRQEEVFNLIYELEEKRRNDIGTRLVNSDKSMLHFAADLFSVSYFDHIQDATLQIQRELQWFKEVESVVPLELHEVRNGSDSLTAHELFTKNHKKLIEDAENSTKGTATSCTVVGALIVTMMFAAAFTVPGGNNGNTGLPLLLDRRLFKVFIVSDTISLVSSTTSVITFLGILTSRYAEEDFLKSLPTKMMIGLFTLLISISTMMIAFSCALVIMLDGEAWIVIPCILFASVPAISFVWLLFPLLGKIFMSTYGPGIFDKKNKVKS